MRLRLLLAGILSFTFLSSSAQIPQAGDYRSVSSTGWSVVSAWQRYDGSSWVAATEYPGQSSGTGLVTLQNGQLMLMDVSPAHPIGGLTIQTGNNQTVLIFSLAESLSVTGTVTIDQTTGTNQPKAISMLNPASHLTCGSLVINESIDDNSKSYLDVSDGSVTVTGNITMGADPDRCFIQFTTGTLNIAGSISGGAIIPGSGTVNFNNNVTNNIQTIPSYNYYNLTVSNAYFLNKKVLGASLTIGGDLTCNGGALYLENNSITLAAGKKCTVNPNSKLVLDGTGTIITTNGGNLLDMKSSAYLELKSATAQIPNFANYAIDDASRLNFNYAGDQPNLTLRGQNWGFTFFEASGTKTITENLSCSSFGILGPVTLNTGTFNIIIKPTGFTVQLFLEGALTGTGKVIFNNDNVSNIANTGGPFTFYDLEMNTATPNLVLSLNKDITVSHTLTLTKGKIFTKTHTLTLSNPTGNNQLIGGSADSYVYSTGAGRLRRNNLVPDFQTFFPVGTQSTTAAGTPKYYMPVTIKSLALSPSFAVSVFEGLTTNGVEGGPALIDNYGVNAVWNVDLVAGSTPAANLTIDWVDQLEGSSFSNLPDGEIGISHYSGGWGLGLSTTSSNSLNSVTRTVSSFSPFAVSKKDYVLPVKFGPITAFEKNNGVQLDWTVFTETNMDKYVVERSANGSLFTPLGEVASRNATGEYKYGYFDANPLPGTSFYRLRSVDIDSKAGFSNIVRVNLDKNDAALRLYPNPANGGAISYQAANLPKGNYAVRIFNAAGQQVYNQRMAHQGGAITQTIQLPAGMAAGQYNLRMESETTVVGTKTFTVQ